MMLGSNLNGVRDWSVQLPFVDVFKMSRKWYWSEDRSLVEENRLDGNGWVKEIRGGKGIVETVLFTNMRGKFKGGRYIVKYRGVGRLDYRLGGRLIERRNGEDVIEINPDSATTVIKILESDPVDYIREIKIVRDGEDETRVFNKDWLDVLSPYKALRFMDWIETNNSTVVKWSDSNIREDRPKVSDARWTIKGVPVEIIVKLCNELNAEPWVCIPHLADDVYVENLMMYLRDNLNSQKVYVEYSNELWNSKFQQMRWSLEVAKAAKVSQLDWVINKAYEVCGIAKRVLGDSRVIGVFATQAANRSLGNQVMKRIRKDNTTINAVAIAPYFGGYLGDPKQANRVRAMSVDNLIDELSTVAIPMAVERMSNYKALCDANGMRLIAYEGGQHLAGTRGIENDVIINNLFDAVNRDARMKDLYKTYLNEWNRVSGDLFCNFTDIGAYSKSGRWGVMEHLEDINAPKYQALLEMV